jgi:hypothetical protein
VPVISTRISPARALRAVRRNKRLFEHYEQLFSAHHSISLVYERMVYGQSLSTAAKTAVFDLLEIDPAPVTGPFVKMNPDNLELIIENYDDLVNALAGTEFEAFLR